MQCPNDGSVLVMSERSGIEIDYCPTCRGVWLDRGELDKIVERAAREFAAPSSVAPPPQPQSPVQPQGPGYGQQPAPAYQQPYDRGYDQGSPRRKKKESWLSELFD
ncbi:zf-TFIIB domain-containing protein [Agromyces sp. NPDC049794]|uniref:TFIIB-type zinc ribbon-containing protein n=1 Tax=unclassified Agromyces TaxID=2639701 RepID=UPI0033CD0E2E